MTTTYNAAEVRLMLRDRAADLMNAALDTTKTTDEIKSLAERCRSLATSLFYYDHTYVAARSANDGLEEIWSH